MKRAFEFIDEKSQKFWWIETSENKFVVNYGKIDTIGKYEIKEWDSVEECEKQATKLINSKIRKGYKEVNFDYNNHYYFDDIEYDIDFLTSHPNFREHFTDEQLYCNCGDEETPFGSDTGNDVLHIIEEKIRKNKNFSFVDFPKNLVEKEWGIEYFEPVSIIDEKVFAEELKIKDKGLSRESIINESDEVVIATAFAQIKITGKIDKELKEKALLSLKRMELIAKICGYGESEINKQLYSDLESFDKLWENSRKLVWIDWREYDEDIINYVEKVIQSGKLIGKNEDTDNKMGFNIIIEWKGKEYKISYPNEEGSDRDTTIKTLNKIIQPEYEIRLFMESLGSDTLAFVPLSKEEWEELEKDFGEEKVNYYFSKIDDNSKMFDLDMDELFEILDKRKEIKNFFD